MRTVEVTLRQLDKLNSLLDGALKAGLNEIRSVSLGVAQPDAYKDKARKAAIDNAIHQAQELANGFHRKLGPVYSVRYHVSNYQPSNGADDESRCRAGVCPGNLRAGRYSV